MCIILIFKTQIAAVLGLIYQLIYRRVLNDKALGRLKNHWRFVLVVNDLRLIGSWRKEITHQNHHFELQEFERQMSTVPSASWAARFFSSCTLAAWHFGVKAYTEALLLFDFFHDSSQYAYI